MGAALAVDAGEMERMDFKVRERRVVVSFRVDESLRQYVEALRRLMKLQALAAGDVQDEEQAEKAINLSFALEHLLKRGAASEWAKFGRMADIPQDTQDRPFAGMPVTDEEWAKLERALVRAEKESQKNRK